MDVLDMTPTRLIVLRHGETAWNKEGRFQGHLDSPLTAAGETQARALGERLKGCTLSALYCSDLGRARSTAAIIGSAIGHTPRVDARLRERHLGVLQGQLATEAERVLPEAYHVFRQGGPDAVIPEGESTRQRFECAIACFEELAGRHAGEQFVVVTHGGVLSCLIRHVLGLPLDAPRRFSRLNGSWNIFLHEPKRGRWTLETWGDVGHLGDGLTGRLHTGSGAAQ